MIYDVIIIGSGPAGVSAAIYAKRNGLSAIVFEKGMPGGIISNSASVENYPGLPNVNGADLAFKFFDHLNTLEIPLINKEVINISLKEDVKVVKTKDEDYMGKSVVLATGRKSRSLGLSNERELFGKGLSTCAVCDGAFYKGKTVAIIGSGNSALDETAYLSQIVNKLYLINRRDDFRADKEIVDKVKKVDNVEIVYNRTVEEIKVVDDKINSIVLDNKEQILVDGVFMCIGYEPNAEFVRELDILDSEGYICIDENYQTKIKGIYAVGDAIKKDYYQIVTAVSDGAIAALNIAKDKTIG